MSKYQLKIPLEQHTPILHFQPTQAGATLRATELKPKLDKWLIEHASEQIDSSWWINGKESKSLRYQMKIMPNGKIDDRLRNQNLKNFPFILANIGKKNSEMLKLLYYNDGFTLYITSFFTNLLSLIESQIDKFFALSNFSNRQNKGFGSFSLKKVPALEKQNYLYFTLKKPKNDFKNVFQEIDLFYRCLKSGLNIKAKICENSKKKFVDKLYFKSLMFKYAKQLEPPQQWDKRTIRHSLYSDNLKYKDDKKEEGVYYKRKDREGTVRFTAEKPKNGNYYDFRDLLGLSTEQKWFSYRSNKKVIKSLSNIAVISGKKEEFKIERFKSPLTFKPFYNEEKECWYIFILLNDIPQEYLGATVDVTNNNMNVELTIYPKFDLAEYLKFAISKFDKKDFEFGENFDENDTDETKMLVNIFNQLFNQLKKQIRR